MRLKTINNNKGSALLWCILMTIIVTILLGSILTATYAYFNYTMTTVKRQQAYFTCRSGIDAIIAELSSTVSGEDPAVLPGKNETLTLSDFELDPKLGEIVSATIKRESPSRKSDSQDKLYVSVTSRYAGEEYTIDATLLNQPLYFAGIAIKELNLGGNLTLGKNTDLYWNNDNTFYSRSQSTGKTITINGNLITKKDAQIYAGTIVAGHRMTSNVAFKSNGKYQKQIWNPSEYIISNKKLDVYDTSTTYQSSTLNNLRNAFNGTTTTRPCNNTKMTSTAFGTKDSGIINAISNALSNNVGFMNDLKTENTAFTASDNNALTINYIKFTTVDPSFFGISLLREPYYVRDISYIQHTSSGENTRSDRVVPVVYLFAEGNTNPAKAQGIRVQFGRDPGKVGILGRVQDYIQNGTDQLLSRFLDYNKNTAYVIVYLGKNAKIELGTTVGVTGVNASNRTQENLIFPYSIYGEEGSEVILNDGVTVLGEINVDKVTVKNGSQGVNVVYSTTNGSQIAKQKVDQYWAVAQYKEGTK